MHIHTYSHDGQMYTRISRNPDTALFIYIHTYSHDGQMYTRISRNLGSALFAGASQHHSNYSKIHLYQEAPAHASV